MEVKVNGQIIDYYPSMAKSIPFYVIQEHVWLVGVKLSPGDYDISIDFIGIKWANLISLAAWIVLILTTILSTHIARSKYGWI